MAKATLSSQSNHDASAQYDEDTTKSSEDYANDINGDGSLECGVDKLDSLMKGLRNFISLSKAPDSPGYVPGVSDPDETGDLDPLAADDDDQLLMDDEHLLSMISQPSKRVGFKTIGNEYHKTEEMPPRKAFNYSGSFYLRLRNRGSTANRQEEAVQQYPQEKADSYVSAGDHRTQSAASHDTAPARKITLLSETLRKVAVASAAAKKFASITKGPSRKGMSVVMDMEVQFDLVSIRLHGISFAPSIIYVYRCNDAHVFCWCWRRRSSRTVFQRAALVIISHRIHPIASYHHNTALS